MIRRENWIFSSFLILYFLLYVFDNVSCNIITVINPLLIVLIASDLYNILFQRLAFLLVHSALSVYSATTRFTETVDSIILIENQLKQNDSIYSLNDQITTQENGPIRFSEIPGRLKVISEVRRVWAHFLPLSIDQNSSKNEPNQSHRPLLIPIVQVTA